MRHFNIVIFASTSVLCCTQLASCVASGETEWSEHQTISASEIVLLQTKAEELLTPVRIASGCRLWVTDIRHGFRKVRGFPDSPKYSVSLREENRDCAGAISELNKIGESDGFSFLVLEVVHVPTKELDSAEPKDFTLIHEIDPEVGN